MRLHNWFIGFCFGFAIGNVFHTYQDKHREAPPVKEEANHTYGIGIDAYGNPICINNTEPEEPKEPFHCC